MANTFKEFINSIDPKSLEETRKKMEKEIFKEAAEKYVEQFGYDRKQDSLAIDFAIGDFIAGAEFMSSLAEEQRVAMKNEVVSIVKDYLANWLDTYRIERLVDKLKEL